MKTVTGIEFQVRFLDVFGDELYTTSKIKSADVIKPNEQNEMDTYWYYEDGGSPYDEVWSFVEANTLKVFLTVTRIAFSDDTVMSFNNEIWAKPIMRTEVHD